MFNQLYCCPGGEPACRQAGLVDVMFFVYAIKSLTRNYIYVGLTNDLDRRLSQHNSGQNRTTKPYGPFEVLLVEYYSTRVEARSREKFLKAEVVRSF
jgi:putative endonuclease